MEFQKKKANESLQHALANMGLSANLDIGPEGTPTGLGPGVTTPSSWSEVPVIENAPHYENPDPPDAAPTEPREETGARKRRP